MQFTPLHVLSSYSLLSSSTKIDDLVRVAKNRGYDSIALTDNNTMYGTVEFYQKCRANDIKPLVGLTIWLDSSEGIDNQFPLVLLAKNTDGYQNLMRISSAKMTSQDTENFSFLEISEYLKDMVVIIPPIRSEVNELMERGRTNQAKKLLARYLKVVASEDLFVSINLKQTNVMRETILQIGKEQGIRCLPLPTVEYIDSHDHFATQVLKDIESGEVINHPEDLAKIEGDNWLKPQEMFIQEYQAAGYEKLLGDLQQVVEKLKPEIPLIKPRLPKFSTPNQLASMEYLTDLCEDAIKAKELDQSSTYTKRLNKELKVIQEMGFADYFLIINDVIEYAHTQKIIAGPGRGSAAGSLVAYLLGITSVDPIQYGLLFERFLNPERAQMPDIDLDIPDDKREQVLKYVHDKYGHQHVGQIITFGTLAAKQAIRDVARVFGEMPQKINQISSLIPNTLNIDLKTAQETAPRLQEFIQSSARNQLLFETAQRLEGLPRHFSTHAAGIVLSQEDLVLNTPVQDGNDGMLMSQYSKNYVERVGLLKMDFLGLRNLSLMANILKELHASHSDFDIETINLNDVKTLEIFQKGDTSGVFQFESSGIRSVLRKVKPDRFELVVAVNALYRPGPMENIDRFVKRKEGRESFNFPNQVLENILGETYGILVYQEQVMEVASAMGGLSLGQADLLRRAMSKKQLKAIEKMKSVFISGAVTKGYTSKIAEQVYRYIERFANYGFNKSHAVAYSKLAFQLAYLKRHFPGAFYTALLNSVIGGDVKTKAYIQELRQLGIQTQAPDVNQSEMQYTLIKGKIKMGFLSIKGLRRDFSRALIQERTEHGKFKSVADFLRRMHGQGISEEIIDKLIYAGALDEFGYNRAELKEYLPELLKGITFSGQSIDLFEKLMPTVHHRPDLALDEKLSLEEEVLGTYVSAHPVERYESIIKEENLPYINQIQANQEVSLIVYIRKIRTIRTKKGEMMAFATLSDPTGECEAVLFPRIFKKYPEFQNKRVFKIDGKVENRNDENQLIINRVTNPGVKQATSLEWIIQVPSRNNSADFQEKLFAIFKRYHGDIPVTLVYQDTQKSRKLSSKFNLQDSNELKKELIEMLGNQHIKLSRK